MKPVWILVAFLLSTSLIFGFLSSSNTDKVFLQELRLALHPRNPSYIDLNALEDAFSGSKFPKKTYGVVLTLHHPLQDSLRVARLSNSKTFTNIMRSIVEILKDPRLKKFNVADPGQCRIQIDFITTKPASFNLGPDFSIGTDGFQAITKDKTHTFLPGDPYVLSLPTVYDLKTYLRGSLGFLQRPQYKRFQSTTYLSVQDDWVKLDQNQLHEYIRLGTDYALRHQVPDGRFLDTMETEGASLETKADYDLPRHANLTLTLLQGYQLFHDTRTLPAAKMAIDLAESYVFPNKASAQNAKKLFLDLVTYYRKLTGTN